ncbi:HNH endonuclease signature motif containing protein [Oryzobacter sp. R7]|uniref:HNH endonuclease signature motif containing protein n=1 Tax=Oryzobacter faecalis TaxID=3388656 RepID=UPI00398CB25D
MTGGTGLGERREAVAAASAALAGLGDDLWQAGSAELAESMTVVDRLEALAAAARVSIAAEAVARGVVAESGESVLSWVRAHAPSLRQGGAGDVAVLAQAVASAGRRLEGAVGGGVDDESTLGIVWAGVVDGSVAPAMATAVLREHVRLDPLLRDEARPTVTRALLELGLSWGVGQMRRLRPRLLAEYGARGAFDDMQSRLAPAACLSAPVVASGDVTEYQLRMTPEQAVAMEAAIGPLSAPAPNEETGERDLRPAGQRRVEALAEVCRRSSALDAESSGGADGAAAASAAVHVTIALTDLETRSGCGEVLGSTATGVVLSPEVLRRLCCEADLIPHVLGTAGEDLDLGRVVRLFTRAQRRALRRRDRGCTYSGCSAPASWTRAHHVQHWADGGWSDLDNAASLCQRHHTLVHQRRLMAEVRRRPDERGRYVVWDLSRGSYDRHLERLARERRAADPEPMTPGRLRGLLAAVGGDDRIEALWADHELHHAAIEAEERAWAEGHDGSPRVADDVAAPWSEDDGGPPWTEVGDDVARLSLMDLAEPA